MIFPYWEVRRSGEKRYLPLVTVTVHGLQSSEPVRALVDSGAEHNVFSSDLAEELEIGISNERAVRIVGFGGEESSGRLVPVALQLGRHRWVAPVIFSEKANHRAILGQAGFFAFFTITFRHSQGFVDIRHSRHSSSWHTSR